MEWRHRDWLWFTAGIVYACGFAYIWKSEVMSAISYVSTFISIALACVAIYISIREATKADNLKKDLNTILGEFKEKLGQVDTKISSLDLAAVVDSIASKYQLEQSKDNVGDDKTDSETVPVEKVNETIQNIANDIKSTLLVGTGESVTAKVIRNTGFDTLFYIAYDSLEKDKPITAVDVQKAIRNLTGMYHALELVEQVMHRHSTIGVLRKENGCYYKK
jgi:hypothetical protein